MPGPEGRSPNTTPTPAYEASRATPSGDIEENIESHPSQEILRALKNYRSWKLVPTIFYSEIFQSGQFLNDMNKPEVVDLQKKLNRMMGSKFSPPNGTVQAEFAKERCQQCLDFCKNRLEAIEHQSRPGEFASNFYSKALKK